MAKNTNSFVADMFELILAPVTHICDMIDEAKEKGEKPFGGKYFVTDLPLDETLIEMGCIRAYTIDGLQKTVEGTHVMSVPIEVHSYRTDDDERVRVFMDISVVIDGTIIATISQVMNENFVQSIEYLVSSADSSTQTEVAHA